MNFGIIEELEIKFTTMFDLSRTDPEFCDEIMEAAKKCDEKYSENALEFLKGDCWLAIAEHPNIRKYTMAIAYFRSLPINLAKGELGGFVLFINKKFWDAFPNVEHRAFFIAHELSHVDLKDLWREIEGLTPLEANIVEDVTIHEMIKPPEEVMEKMKPATVETVFYPAKIDAARHGSCEYYANLYLKLKEKLPPVGPGGLPVPTGGSPSEELARQAAENIKEQYEGEEEVWGKIAEEIAKKIEEELEKEGIKIDKEQLEKIKEDIKEEYKEPIPEGPFKKAGRGRVLQKFGYKHGDRIILTVYDWSEIFNTVFGQSLEKSRSEYIWTRPWKKTGFPPGTIEVPSYKVGILFDVSGSMTGVAEEIARVLRGLFHQYIDEAEFWVVEVDEVVQKGPYRIDENWEKFSPETGGGTYLDPGIVALNEYGPFDIFIFATDGETYPLKEYPNADTIVALYPEYYKSLKEYYPDIIEIVVKKEKVFRVV
ncbi:MAG: hypothetical protein LWW95_08285 [Candidatus Desulfofervidus auxilii]|nr:hypothetical protein [Candidatus Desulfofervidus auxilii]